VRRLLVLVTVLLATLCVSAQAKPLLGIADQKPSIFTDSRLQALHLGYARIYVPWDVLQDKNTLPVVDDWMAGAKLDNMEPLVTIARSRIEGRASYNPSPAQLAGEFQGWRRRWPGQVDRVSTWNEANLGKSPELVASWWLALRKGCPTCTVLGADLLDEPKVLTWTTRFVAAAKTAPAVWGLHAYNDANTYSTTITKALLKNLKGDFWITETGGVASRARPIYQFKACGVAHQTKATKFLLEQIAGLSPRIKRIYIFTWSLGDNNASFDSALIDAEGRERPALNLLRTYLGQAPISDPESGVSPELTSCKKGTAPVKPLVLPKPAKPGKPTKSGKPAKPAKPGKPGKGKSPKR
jgi:hypothetical protein